MRAPPEIIWHCEKCRRDNKPVFVVYNPLAKDGICHIHKSPMVEINITKNDFDVMFSVSQDVNFFDAMIALKEKDIIEYELKMSQFRNSYKQQEAVREDNTPRCPHCRSTNIKSISGLERGVSIFALGIFSKKINKSFKCDSCGYTW